MIPHTTPGGVAGAAGSSSTGTSSVPSWLGTILMLLAAAGITFFVLKRLA